MKTEHFAAIGSIWSKKTHFSQKKLGNRLSYFVSEETAPEERDSGKKKRQTWNTKRKGVCTEASCIPNPPSPSPPLRKQHF